MAKNNPRGMIRGKRHARELGDPTAEAPGCGASRPAFTRVERRLTDAELLRMTREAQENGDGSYPDVDGWPDNA